jgi:hypothetical protein
MGQDERGAGDVADFAGAGGDVLEGAPALVEQGESLVDKIAKATGLTADEIMAIEWAPVLTVLNARGLSDDPAEIRRLARHAPSEAVSADPVGRDGIVGW